jgi:death-on-curing protein
VSREPRWISKAAALAIHGRLLAEHGGAAGLLDEGALDAALASPSNHFAHGEKDLFRLAAAYAHAISRNHPFQDGNKRVALTRIIHESEKKASTC